MADGVIASDVDRRDATNISKDPPRIAPWLLRTRAGFLTLWSIGAAVALSSVLSYEVIGPGGILNEQSKWYFLAASTLLWLPLLLLLLDPSESLASGPRLLLPFATLLILVGLTAVAIIDQLNAHRLLAGLPQKTAFFGFLSLVFISRVWNAANFARYKATNLKAAERAAAIELQSSAPANRTAEEKVDKELQQFRNAESLGAVLATVVVLAVVAGALWVGTFKSPPQMGSGLGFAIFVIVVGVFATIVFLDWISRFRPLRMLAKTLHATAPRMHFLVNFYDWIDAGLVRIGGHVAGADHIKTRSRYSVLGGTLACLALLGWFLEPPLGLVPVALGLVTALSLSRLWSWVEEDRNLASITQFSPRVPQKVGFREDYRDETLLGFIFVLVLIPIGMMQAHEGNVLGGPLFNRAETGQPFSEPYDFGQWLGYFGFELAKALPIVDWADIYTLGPGRDSIQPTRPLGMHAVFAARVIVDLVLIAALLQAVGIASRNRQQKSLYAIRRIDRLDELVEKAALGKAIRETRKKGGAVVDFDLAKLGEPDLVDFRHYNELRLRQLRAGSAPESEMRVFIDKIFAQAGWTAEPAIVIAQNIAASHRNELELFKMFEQALREHEAGIHRLQIEEIRTLLFELRNQSGMKEFKQELIDTAVKRMGVTPETLLDTLATTAVGPKGERDQFRYTAKMATEAIMTFVSKLTDPQAVSDALELFRRNGQDAFGAAQHLYQSAVAQLEQRLAALRPTAQP